MSGHRSRRDVSLPPTRKRILNEGTELKIRLSHREDQDNMQCWQKFRENLSRKIKPSNPESGCCITQRSIFINEDADQPDQLINGLECNGGTVEMPNQCLPMNPDTESTNSMKPVEYSMSNLSTQGTQANIYHCRECRHHIKYGRELVDLQSESDTDRSDITCFSCKKSCVRISDSPHTQRVAEQGGDDNIVLGDSQRVTKRFSCLKRKHPYKEDYKPTFLKDCTGDKCTADADKSEEVFLFSRTERSKTKSGKNEASHEGPNTHVDEDNHEIGALDWWVLNKTRGLLTPQVKLRVAFFFCFITSMVVLYDVSIYFKPTVYRLFPSLKTKFEPEIEIIGHSFYRKFSEILAKPVVSFVHDILKKILVWLK